MKLKLLVTAMFVAMAVVLIWWVVVMDGVEPGHITLDSIYTAEIETILVIPDSAIIVIGRCDIDTTAGEREE